jgi:hypothetical protein
MALDTNIRGTTSGAGADVNASNQLKVVLETNAAGSPGNVGGIRNFSENDPGAITGTPYLASPETSTDYRLRVGIDSIWDDEEFCYTTQNQNKHKVILSGAMAFGWAGGFLSTNSGSITTTGTGCQLQTYRHFPIQGSGGVYFEQAMALSSAPVTNWVLDFGGFLPAATALLTPLDGTYFRVTSAGVFGVVNSNGTEVTTSVFTFTPTPSTVFKYNISLTDTEVEFWINDILYGTLSRQTGTGSTIYSGSIPFAIRHWNSGSTSAAISAKFANYTVSLMDMDNLRDWDSSKAGQQLSGIVYPSGATAGQTSSNANSTVPATAALSNTASTYASLGGKFLFAGVAGVETDYALFTFTNPAPTTSLTGRNLVVKGIWIDSAVSVILPATALILEWSVGVGSTALTLATTDGAAARGAKRLSLGTQGFLASAAVGTVAPQVNVSFPTPLVVEPGTLFQIILRVPVGTATTPGTIRGSVGVSAYWE